MIIIFRYFLFQIFAEFVSNDLCRHSVREVENSFHGKVFTKSSQEAAKVLLIPIGNEVVAWMVGARNKVREFLIKHQLEHETQHWLQMTINITDQLGAKQTNALVGLIVDRMNETNLPVLLATSIATMSYKKPLQIYVEFMNDLLEACHRIVFQAKIVLETIELQMIKQSFQPNYINQMNLYNGIDARALTVREIVTSAADIDTLKAEIAHKYFAYEFQTRLKAKWFDLHDEVRTEIQVLEVMKNSSDEKGLSAEALAKRVEAIEEKLTAARVDFLTEI